MDITHIPPKEPPVIKTLEELLGSLPEYMTKPDCRRWLLWCSISQGDEKKPRKVPHYANGHTRGKTDTSKDLNQLVNFDQAYAALATGKFTGLGFALGADGQGGHWQGIDLDNLIAHPNFCILKPPGYAELSPSKNGLHFIGYGKKFVALGDNKTGIEAYSHGRFLTVTGTALNELWGLDVPIQAVCLANYVEQTLQPMHGTTATPKKNSQKASVIITDELLEHLESALKFISADDGKTWIAMGYALHELGDAGYKLWAEWSATSENHKGDVDLARWNGLKADRTGYAAVFARAQANGWVNPCSIILPDPKTVGFGNEPLSANTILASSPSLTRQFTHYIEPLPELPTVLPFDYSYLPVGLREYVCDISERMQCPADYASVAVYIMIATVCGRKIGIRPMKENDWTVIPNLWGAVVGNSGMMKSPTLNECLSPLKKLAAKETEIFNNAIAEYCLQGDINELQKSVNKSKAKEALKKQKDADIRALLTSEKVNNVPILKRYITNNASYEALGELLMENPNGILVESDEIIGLLKQLDKSGQEGARAFYLTAADGDKAYTFDRIIRGKGLRIESVCVSIIGGIQPGVLADYVSKAINGSAGADGLLQRFGLMVYPDIAPDWKEVDRPPNKIARANVTMLVEKIDNFSPFDIGAGFDSYGGVPFLRFTDAAQCLFSRWRGVLEKRLRSGEEHPAIISHLSKYRKLVPSLALLNHLCDSRKGSVSAEALQSAIAYSEYLESHARRIYSYATTPEIDAAKTVLKRLATGKLTNPFKARDLSQKDWTGLSSPDKAQAAITVVLEYGHLYEEDVIPETGGRPTKIYHWRK